MPTYTKTLILGNVGRPPELQYLLDGRAVTDFSVAVNRTWTSKSGQEHKEATWFKIKAWGRLAELCYEKLQKGSRVFIEGRLSPDRNTGSPHVWYSEGKAMANYDIAILHISFISNLKPRSDAE